MCGFGVVDGDTFRNADRFYHSCGGFGLFRYFQRGGRDNEEVKMKVINKILIAVLAFCMIFALVGCVDDDNTTDTGSGNSGKIDFDLAAMGPNSTYAMFQNLNKNTNEYLNKSFKIPGTYYLMSDGSHTVFFPILVAPSISSLNSRGLTPNIPNFTKT